MASFQARASYKKCLLFYETAAQSLKEMLGGHILAAKRRAKLIKPSG